MREQYHFSTRGVERESAKNERKQPTFAICGPLLAPRVAEFITEAGPMPLAVIGVDIDKEFFHLVGFSADGKIAFARRSGGGV